MSEMPVPFDRRAIAEIVESQKFDVRTASIREMNNVINAIEKRLDAKFVRMEFGVPGLPVDEIAVSAETAALRDKRVGHIYAPFEGVPELKAEAARFVKLYMDIDVPPECCVPTVGAMQGCFVSMALAGRVRKRRDTILFLEPGFPVNKLQQRFLGLKSARIDFYDHRGEKLIDAIRQRVAKGDICALIWSSPNNPTWVSLKESELEGIGKICDENDLLAIEDLAYFGMDTRKDYFTPGGAPFQPSVMRYTKSAITIISSSKIFSYAGQRIAIAVIGRHLMDIQEPDLVEHYGTSYIGHAFMHGCLYPITASVPESSQHGLLALLRAVNEGRTELFAPAKEYARRAKIMKKYFLANGFEFVYDNDLGEPLADGFYFTVRYPGFDSGAELIREMMHYGISAITLETTGSVRTEGLRACVSLTSDEQFGTLEYRLRRFHEDHTR